MKPGEWVEHADPDFAACDCGPDHLHPSARLECTRWRRLSFVRAASRPRDPVIERYACARCGAVVMMLDRHVRAEFPVGAIELRPVGEKRRALFFPWCPASLFAVTVDALSLADAVLP